MGKTSYAVALGSNRRHHRHGVPAGVLAAAAAALGGRGIEVEAFSQVIHSRALGPPGRAFANAAMVVTTDFSPPELLTELKRIERMFGRRGGRRWGSRVLDLDILLWSGGPYVAPGLVIPHRAMRERAFVLHPLAQIAPAWVDPISGATMRQLRARLRAPRPVDPAPARP